MALDAADGPVVEGANLLAPVVPTEMLCIGLNYRKHAEESGARVPDHPRAVADAGRRDLAGPAA